MIKASELRIGNIIGWRTGFGQLVTGPVFQIEPDKIAISQSTPIDDNTSGQSFMKLEGVEPTPLTPKWLDKFGFVESNSYTENVRRFRKDNFTQLADYGGQMIVLPEGGFAYLSCGYYKNEIDCAYVHQLQNLYFALTGEELTIKETV